MKLCTNMHGPQRINPSDFGDPLIFRLAHTAGQIYNMILTSMWFEVLAMIKIFQQL